MPKVVFNPLTQDFDFTGGGSSTWGSITGTLSSQTDLQNALNAKANDSDTVHKTGAETVAGSKTFSNDLSVNGTSYLGTTNVYGDLTMKTGTHLVLDSDPTTAMQAVTKQYADALGGITFTSDTKANILATTPTAGTYAISTDTEELLLWDGSAWRVASIALSEISVGQDQGWTQDNDKRGYGEDYTDGKKHTSMGIGAFNETPYEGAIKVDASQSPITFEIYLRGQWNQIFYDFQMVNGDLEHIPETYVIDVRSGNSNEVGLNGIPIVQEYSVDQGCYPYPTVIDGGTL